MPTQMFYNTGISTYVWILSNNKEPRRKDKVQLIDATTEFDRMRRNLGDKSRQLSAANIARITKTYGAFLDSPVCKILPNDAFGFSSVTIERPLRLTFQVTPTRMKRLAVQKVFAKTSFDFLTLESALSSIDPTEVFRSRHAFLSALDVALSKAGLDLTTSQYKAVWQAFSERDATADICLDSKGAPEADPELRDTETIPLAEEIQTFFAREVKPFVRDAWVNLAKVKLGYEVPFSRYFYEYLPPRALEEIDEELQTLTASIMRDLAGLDA